MRVRGEIVIQEWYPGMLREEEVEGCVSSQSNIESQLFEGFDSSKASLSESLHTTATPTASVNGINSVSGSARPILNGSGGASRRTIHTLNAPPSSVFSPGTQTQIPAYPPPALRSLVSPISPTLNHLASFSQSPEAHPSRQASCPRITQGSATCDKDLQRALTNNSYNNHNVGHR